MVTAIGDQGGEKESRRVVPLARRLAFWPSEHSDQDSVEEPRLTNTKS